ncbi:MAG: hypothetical protein Ta2B_08600 [Termitinemataceae bacterium]|nr:MAG: hypothetical protein Ta2B_08600 [Termitinemataceae bacterium]
MYKKYFFLTIFLCVVCVVSVFAQDDISQDDISKEKKSPFVFSEKAIGTSTLKLDFPLFDLPYQIDAMNTVGHGFFSSYANPSMSQSIALTADFYTAFHFGAYKLSERFGFEKSWWKKSLYYSGIALLDYFSFYVPFGYAWMHEENHRAVMTRFGINSYNEAYDFRFGASTIAVTGITDEEFEVFKSEHPKDFIRMEEAGIESQYVLIDKLERNAFFYNQNYLNEFLYLFITLNAYGYMSTTILSDYYLEDIYKEINAREPEERDFTGLDPIAWVYDLFRPNEPYHKRGENVLGGVDRYRQVSMLTKEERDYLYRRVAWSALNFVSPMLYGIKTIQIGEEGLEFNFALRNWLTSFGSEITLTTFWKIPLLKRQLNMIWTYHHYQNYQNFFPALEAELLDFPIKFKKWALYISPKFIVGVQPKDMDFKTSDVAFFGLIGGRVDFEFYKHVLPYIEFSAKTSGWVAGNEFLDSTWKVIVGTSLRF